ncbi:MAG: hypothetical protein KGK35_09675 [Xanthomonadaceae bacterium]|nr:hypothetical protein [Xanthomonadaceae bacterium]
MKIAAPIAILLLGISSSPVLAAQSSASWYWFTSCGGPTIKLEFQLDHKAVFTTEFPMCKSDHRVDEADRKVIDFTFTPKVPLDWNGYGYKDSVVSLAGKPIKARLWLAGSDHHLVILGVALSDDRNGPVMNTLAIVYPNKSAKWNIGPGLFITSSSSTDARPSAAREDHASGALSSSG